MNFIYDSIYDFVVFDACVNCLFNLVLDFFFVFCCSKRCLYFKSPVYYKIFGKNIGSSLLRNIFLTDKYKDTKEEMEQDVKAMKHQALPQTPTTLRYKENMENSIFFSIFCQFDIFVTKFYHLLLMNLIGFFIENLSYKWSSGL